MKYSFKMPTQIFQESECVKNHPDLFEKCGKKAVIITGKNSAKACGALQDVIDVLESKEISYLIFDQIENNPSLDTVEIAAQKAKDFSGDFVIGIGGGSPIDAAKAVAVLTVNKIAGTDLFLNEFEEALPIIGIPTTAGTGSEITPYSVLLRKDLKTKLSFGNEKTIPTYALLDAKYTNSLSEKTTVYTAIDAFTHSLEGYLSNRATVISDAFAIDGIRTFGECIKALKSRTITEEIRQKLMYASMIGGLVIAHTGVTIAHGMGYCYTYFKDIPHGQANGILMKTYLEYIYEYKKDKIALILQYLDCNNLDEFGHLMDCFVGSSPMLSKEEVMDYTELTCMQKGSMGNTARFTNREEVLGLWEIMRKEGKEC